MIRISGILLPDEKPIVLALTSIFGIGKSKSDVILASVKVKPQIKTKDISIEDEAKIRAYIEKNFKVEGDLKSEIINNIRRLKDIHSYKGLRHIHNLPVHGQRTKTNARTKRGKKVTVGSGRKKSAEKT